MIHNNKKYIPLINDYVENRRLDNLEDDVIHDWHKGSFYLDEVNNQNTEEKVTIFKKDDIYINNNLSSSASVPGQNISFLFLYSIFFSLTVCLIITILLKTQKYINIDTAFPKRVYLNSFILDNFSYINQSFTDESSIINAFSNISQISIDESVFLNINESGQVFFKNNVFAKDGIDHHLFSLNNNSFEFNQNYGRNLQILPDVVVTGRLKASSISFGPFRIEHNILTNTLDPITSQVRLFSSESNNIVTDFLLKEDYLIVVEKNVIYVFYIDPKEIKSIFKPKLIYKKSYYDKEQIVKIDTPSMNTIFIFHFSFNKSESASIECKNKQCFEINYNFQNDKYISELYDKFGAKIELQETKNKKCQLSFCFDINTNECSYIPIQIDSSSTGCGSAKVSVNEEGNSYIVIPEKKIVRIFEDMDELNFRDEPLNIPFGSKYHPVQMSSYVIALNNGALDIFSF